MDGKENSYSIKERKYNKLITELSKILKRYKDDQELECIYFTPLMVTDKRARLLVTIIYNDLAKCLERDKESSIKYDSYHIREKTLKKCGIEINIKFDTSEKYSFIDLEQIERNNRNCLYNSTILYDKTGKYTDIKASAEKILASSIKMKIKNCGIYKYDNLTTIYPNLYVDEILIKAKIKKLD